MVLAKPGPAVNLMLNTVTRAAPGPDHGLVKVKACDMSEQRKVWYLEMGIFRIGGLEHGIARK